ncbi:PLP-dependent aminotransferase family protein, partial [Pseudomonas aeruginosa]
RNGQVAYLGTFSKTLFPGLRLGYLLPPASLREAVLAARKLVDRHSETLQQRALALFIQRGDFARHTRRLQREYAQRRGRLLERLHGDLSPWLEALPAVAGIHLAARCREPLDVLRIARHLRQQGLEVGTLPPFYAETPAQAGFLFGFGCIERDDIDPALDLLRAELRR